MFLKREDVCGGNTGWRGAGVVEAEAETGRRVLWGWFPCFLINDFLNSLFFVRHLRVDPFVQYVF